MRTTVRLLQSTTLLGVAAILAIAMVTRDSLAQGGSEPIENSAGLSFIVGFPDTTSNTIDPRYPNNRFDDKCFFFIYSAVDNKISIRGSSYQRIGMHIRGGAFTIVDLMQSDEKAPNPITTDQCKATRMGIFRIEAQSPVIVYQYMVTKFGSEAWTAIPVEAWGNEHYAACVPGEVGSDVSPGGEWDYNRRNKMFSGVILVVAAYDNTTVNIIPNGQLHNCNATSVVLDADEAYQVESWVDTLTANQGTPQPDLGGTRIFSDKPVGVISGNTRAQVIDEVVGLGKNIFKNLLIEWVPPIDQHGTQFVYMPTWDARRPTGSPNEDLSEKRKAEFVRVYGTRSGVTSGYFVQSGAVVNYRDAVRQGQFEESRHTPNLARVHYTDRPAQAMMHSSAVVRYAGTTQGWGGYIGAAYDGWGPYMVEMTPREQWVSFAPYYCSNHPAGMEHYINLVTDTAHAMDVYLRGGANFIFNRGVIAGTDLIWGSMSVAPGIDQWIEGRNGAKFYGFVYGTFTKGGHEEYRPGRTRTPDDPPPALAAGGGGADDGDGRLLHASEYEEYGIGSAAYGYPLAPSRLVVSDGDSLDVVTRQDCRELTIEIRTLNENPVGLRLVRLDNAENAKIYRQDPFPITGAKHAVVVIRPINARQDAHAIVVIKDRSGKIQTLRYDYYAEVFAIDPSPELDFGIMTPGTARRLTATIINPAKTALHVQAVRLVRGDQGFRIISPSRMPLSVAPGGGTAAVEIEASPNQPDRAYADTLVVVGTCDSMSIVLHAETANPCIDVSDLDFGVLAVGQSRTLDLRICNNGGGEVRFNNPSGGAVVEWLLKNFSMASGDIDRVLGAVLGRGECLIVKVTFRGDAVGSYQTTARFWANTRHCRDTSVWRARVTTPGPQITGYDWEKRWLTVANACTKNDAARYESIVQIYNTGSSDFRIESVAIEGADRAHFALGDGPRRGDNIRFSSLDPPEFLYPQVVYFMPDAEREFDAEIVLVSSGGDTVRNSLAGTGIETHVAVQQPNDFGRHLWSGGMAGIRRTVVVTSTGTRPLTVTGVRLAVGRDFAFVTPPSLPTVLAPGDALPVQVEYRPTLPGSHTDELIVEGDHSHCDDSIAEVSGRSFMLSASAAGEAFGPVLTCFDRSGTAVFRNTGNDPVRIHRIVPGGDPVFGFVMPATPVVVDPDKTLSIPVTFAPGTPGSYLGTLTFVVTDTLDRDTVWTSNGDPIVAFVTGDGVTRRATASLARTYHGLPGATTTLELRLDQAIGDARIEALRFVLRWPAGMMQIVMPPTDEDFVTGTSLDGWTVTMSMPPIPDPGNARYQVMTLDFAAPAGRWLDAPAGGVLARLPFRLFLGDTASSELPFDLSPVGREACATIEARPGFAWIDSVCGLNFRLISSFGTTYTLRPNTPNPFSADTDIRFSLGLDGPTRLTIYDASGIRIATLIDGYMSPGDYTITWDPGNLPAGLYYYRLESGAWSDLRTMMLRK